MPSTAGQFAAHEEIGDDVDVGAERQVLIDRLDAGRLGCLPDCGRGSPGPRTPTGRGRLRPPEMILTTGVDLPAPLSPSSATTSPLPMVKLIPLSALDGPVVLADVVQFGTAAEIGHAANPCRRADRDRCASARAIVQARDSTPVTAVPPRHAARLAPLRAIGRGACGH